MKLPEIKRLAESYSKEELLDAAKEFENSLENKLNVQGSDDGDKLSNLLMSIEVKKKIESGSTLNEAVKELSSRVRSVLS